MFLKVLKWCIDLEQLGGWVYFDSKVVSFDYTQIVDKVPYSDKKIFCNGCCQGNVRNNKVGNLPFLQKKKKEKKRKKERKRRKIKEKKKWVSVYRSFLEWLQSPIRHFTEKIRQIPRTLYRAVGMKIFNRQAVRLHWWRYRFSAGGGRGRSYGEFEIALLILFRVRKGIVKVAFLNWCVRCLTRHYIMYISRNFCQSIPMRVTITILELTQADPSSNLALLRARHWFSMKEDVTS